MAEQAPTAVKAKFVQMTRIPDFVGVAFKSALKKRIRIVKVIENGQAEVLKKDLYEVLDSEDKKLFTEHFGKDTNTCFLKVGAFVEC